MLKNLKSKALNSRCFGGGGGGAFVFGGGGGGMIKMQRFEFLSRLYTA